MNSVFTNLHFSANEKSEAAALIINAKKSPNSKLNLTT